MRRSEPRHRSEPCDASGAVTAERTSSSERASESERTRSDERARVAERTITAKRASAGKRTKKEERAKGAERTNTKERRMAGTWIVMTGTLLDTDGGGGLELFGPFSSEKEAQQYRHWCKKRYPIADVCLAIELLNVPSAFERDNHSLEMRAAPVGDWYADEQTRYPVRKRKERS
jgi:hypothetical protein